MEPIGINSIKLFNVDNYDSIIKEMEQKEFDLQPMVPSNIYIQLLALYLFKGDNYSAKLLWRRIPDSIKSSNVEIITLQKLITYINSNKISEFFKTMKFDWSLNIRDIMKVMLEKAYNEVFTLIEESYHSVFESSLMQITLLSSNELKTICTAREWNYSLEGENVILKPLQRKVEPHRTISSEDQLFQLTSFVTFLEN